MPLENHTIHPSRGDLLFYPGGVSETELLFTNRSAKFASKAGDLAENHFMTIVAGMDRLGGFGNFFLWNGAQDIEFNTG